ncbi:MAG TPA: hypothetical protein VGJ66_13155 [Pyrinomonadaceae bacterium]|jgi:hypothetical protein
MLTQKRTLLLVGVGIAVLIALWLVLARNCPSAGIALTSNARNLHRLKNRTAFPQESDFDSRITLDELLRPDDDSNRWSTEHAARIQAQVIDVAYARSEAANCFSPCRRDIHILVANREGAAKNEQVVVEVTPNLRESTAERGIDWSEQTLQALLVGHWCEFEGWLYFDVGHAEQSENTAPHNPTNWRATAWELHPVTKITVIR